MVIYILATLIGILTNRKQTFLHIEKVILFYQNNKKIELINNLNYPNELY